MIRIAVCDDDLMYLKSLKGLFSAALKKADLSADVSFFTTGNDIINDFLCHRPFDIVILDIDMPDIDGKTVAQKLRIIDSSFFLVFLTAYKSEVYNTIPYRINAFISKDCDTAFIISELSRVFREYKDYSPQFEMFTVLQRNMKQVIRIPTSDIFYFYCARKTTYLVTGTEELRLVTDRFSYIADSYRDKGFFEVCRGCMVNISKVKVIRNSEIVLDNDRRLHLSRGRKNMLLDEVSYHISREDSRYGNASPGIFVGSNR